MNSWVNRVPLNGSDTITAVVPHIDTKREALRVSEVLFKTTNDLLGQIPAVYQVRAAGVFSRIYHARLLNGAKPFKARNAGNAELKIILKAIDKALKGWRLPVAALYSAEMRKRAADRLVYAAKAIARNCGGDAVRVYRDAGALYIEAGVIPAKVKDEDKQSAAAARMMCEQWAKRKLEVLARYHRENISIAWGDVGKQSPYVSKRGLHEYKSAVARGEKFLESVLLVNDELEAEVSLLEAARKSASNPRIREIELNLRVDGLTAWAEENKYKGYFITATAPSQYHRNKGKQYNGNTPKNTQEYMCEVWARVRARLKKSKIDYKGLRVVEPHKDATPHWHLLIFVSRENVPELARHCRECFTEKDGEELNTRNKRKARFDMVKLKNAKHAARYVAKYISKNIDGKALDKKGGKESMDKTAEMKATTGAERAVAWSRLHSIRQFQFFGVKSITLYREIRRLQVKNASEEIQELIDATGGKKGDDVLPNWQRFEQLAHKAQLIKEQAQSKYGETVKKIKGVYVAGQEFITRIGEWKQETLSAKRSEARKENGHVFSWKVGNNCNFQLSQPIKMGDSLLMPVGGNDFKLRYEKPCQKNQQCIS